MIIPDNLYLNKEKLRKGVLCVTIGDEYNEQGLSITHGYIDSDIIQDKIDEAYRKGSERGYNEGYLDGSLESKREEEVG